MTPLLTFDTWSSLDRVVLVGVVPYALLIVLLHVSGKRTLPRLDAFDLVVAVALGSTLASVLLSNAVPLAEGVLALALLVSLQFIITWLSVRSPRFRTLVKSEPTLIPHDGRMLDGALRAQQVNRKEVMSPIRAEGLRDSVAVALETDGSFSVIPSSSGSPLPVGATPALAGVGGGPTEGPGEGADPPAASRGTNRKVTLP